MQAWWIEILHDKEEYQGGDELEGLDGSLNDGNDN